MAVSAAAGARQGSGEKEQDNYCADLRPRRRSSNLHRSALLFALAHEAQPRQVRDPRGVLEDRLRVHVTELVPLHRCMKPTAMAGHIRLVRAKDGTLRRHGQEKEFLHGLVRRAHQRKVNSGFIEDRLLSLLDHGPSNCTCDLRRR